MAFHFYGSRVPARVLGLEACADRWADVPTAVLASLQHAFACGKPFARAPLADDRWHVFHFTRMLRYDEAEPGASTAATIAWHDEAGAGFFPPGKAHIHVDPSDGCRAVGEDEAVGIVRKWNSEAAVVPGAERCVAGDSLTRVFREKERELGNTKLGWYGASPADVKMAGKTLFRLPNWNLLGERRAHGRGLHLSPLRFPHLSMGIAEADLCMLLCRIVQGLPVAIHAGSNQSCNTMHELKSVGGVDYLPNPSWYAVWAEHMNMCIVPLCVVSFMKRPADQVLVFVDMKKLCKEIKKFLPSPKLHDLDNYFDTDTNRENSQKDRNMACNHLPLCWSECRVCSTSQETNPRQKNVMC